MVVIPSQHESEGPTNLLPESADGRIFGTATDTDSIVPEATVDALIAGYIIEESVINGRQCQLAGDASVTKLGVLMNDQVRFINMTYDHTTPLTYAYSGPVNVLAGAIAIPKHAYVCSDATGRARPWQTGFDSPLSVLGISKTASTAAGDRVEVNLGGI